MADSRKHIDKFLKEKWLELKFPSNDDDWSDFERHRNRKKRKPFLFGFFILSLSAAVIALFTLFPFAEAPLPGQKTLSDKSDLYMQQGPGRKNMEESVPGKKEPGNSGDRAMGENDKKTQDNSKPNRITGSKTGKNPSESHVNNTYGKNHPEKNTGEPPQRTFPVAKDILLPGDSTGDNNIILAGERLDSPFLWSSQLIEGKTGRINLLPGEENPVKRPVMTAIEKNRRKGLLPGFNQSVFFSLSYMHGQSKAKQSIPEDTTLFHKHYYEKMDEGMKESSLRALSFGYRMSPFRNLQVSAGVEYNTVSQAYNFQYENREIPVVDTNDRILGYIIIPDNQPGVRVSLEGAQNISSLVFPLQVNYTVNLSRRFSLGVSGMASLGFGFGKNIKTIDPVSIEESTINAINRFRFNFGGTVFGEYRFTDAWGIQLGLQLKKQNQLYNRNIPFNIQNQLYGVNFLLIRYL